MKKTKESVNKKIIKLLALVLVISVFAMLSILLFVEEQQKYDNTEDTVSELNDAIIHSVTFSMAEGSTDVTPFSERIKKIENIRDFQVLASDLIREKSNEKMDDLEKLVMSDKKTYFEEEVFKEEDVYRSIRPILADSTCVDCHDQAKSGDVLAIVNMRYSISSTKADIVTQRISAFVMALVMISIIFFLLKSKIKKQIIDDLIRIAEHFKVLSTGKLNAKIDSERNDEIGELIKSIEIFQNSLLEKTNSAINIADGNLSTEIKILSIDDSLGLALQKVKENLNLLTIETNTLCNHAINGELENRADATKLNGEYSKILTGINQILDNVTAPLQVAAVYIDRISKGDLPETIKENYKGEFNKIINNINLLIESSNSVSNNIIRLSNGDFNIDLKPRSDKDILVKSVIILKDNLNKIYQEIFDLGQNIKYGKIDVNVDESNYFGAYRSMVEGLKQGFLGVVKILNQMSSNVMISDNQGNISFVNNSMLRLLSENINNFHKVNSTLDFTSLKGKNISSLHNNEAFKIDLLSKLNDTHISTINISEKIFNVTINPIKDLQTSKNNAYVVEWIDFTDEMNFKNELEKTIKNMNEGLLKERMNIKLIGGIYKNTSIDINNMLDSILQPLNVAAEYVDRISKGDIPPKINDDYNGDFNEIKNNLNQAIDAINLLVSDTKMLSDSAIEGKLDKRADAKKHFGDFNAIINGINSTLDNVINPLNVAADYVDRISKGDIPEKISDNYNGDFNIIKDNLNTCIDAINLLVSDAKMLSNAAKLGKLDTRANATNHQGDFRAIVQGVNDTLDNVIGPLNVAAEYVDRISKGDIPPKINDDYNGDFNEIKNNLNQAIDAIAALVKDATFLSISAENGILSARADSNKHEGEFKVIINGVNKTLDQVVAPINEAAEILSQMSTGDLTVRMFGNYNGDLAKLKEDINALGESLSQLINQVNDSVQNTASAALEISSTAEGLAASFQEQSSQTDDVASAVEEMSRTVTDNAMSATRTAEVANKNGEIATEGAVIVKQTVSKMRDIANVVENSAKNIQKLGESSKQIGEIISVINEIADQTNLLALNAAIEAARAGEQGRGFAVVADEVRKLAERTSGATKQIANMIKGIQSETESAVVAMNQGTIEVQKGIEYADRAGESLNEILNSTQELLDMINQIAAASEQQSATSEEIAKNVISISKVAAESNQRIEDVAHTSDELAKLTEHLRDLMSNFQVEENNSNILEPKSKAKKLLR